MPVKRKISPSPFLKKNTAALFLALLLGPFFPADGHAHKVYIFAWTEGETVHTDSYYPNTKKVINGTIRVYNPEGEKLLEGKTGEQGAFSFQIPQKTDLKIVLEASMGHKTEFLLPADEFSSLVKKPKSGTRANMTGPAPSASSQVNADMLREVLEEVIDARLKPIHKKLAGLEREKGPALRDVIGGIGYILGLMGVVLYFKSHRKK
ncbi:MAG: hypothetical protein ABII06_05425 [Pseudomonadota bacterium]